MKRSKKNSSRNTIVNAMMGRHPRPDRMRHRCNRRQKDEGRIRKELDY
jgi:hypothetical protein